MDFLGCLGTVSARAVRAAMAVVAAPPVCEKARCRRHNRMDGERGRITGKDGRHRALGGSVEGHHQVRSRQTWLPHLRHGAMLPRRGNLLFVARFRLRKPRTCRSLRPSCRAESASVREPQLGAAFQVALDSGDEIAAGDLGRDQCTLYYFVVETSAASIQPATCGIAAPPVALAKAVITQGRVAEGRALLVKHLDALGVDCTAHPDDITATRRELSSTDRPVDAKNRGVSATGPSSESGGSIRRPRLTSSASGRSRSRFPWTDQSTRLTVELNPTDRSVDATDR